MSDDTTAPLAKRKYHKSTPEQRAERERLFEDRVEYVMNLMREFKYINGITRDRIAEEWDLPRMVAHKICKEASVRLRAEYAEADMTFANGLPMVDKVMRNAFATGNYALALRAFELWVQATGAAPATKIEVAPDMASMSWEQLQARKAEIVARLTGKPAVEVLDVKALPPKSEE